MSDKLIRKKYDMLVLKSQYMKAQLDINQDIFEEAQEEFAKAYNEVCKTVPEHERAVLEGAMQKEQKQEEEKDPPPPSGDPEPEPDTPSSKKTESKSVRNIYRAIAKESHPDKLVNATEEETEEKEELFKEAQLAAEQENLIELIEIAKKLKIEPPDPGPEQIEILEKNIKNINEGIKMINKTTAWQWHHEKDDETKNAILIRYMQYIYTTFK